ncbi:hypothetical protein MTO96_018607 [Rhipicephalus appendiculatus]
MPESGRAEDKRRDSNELPPSSDPYPLSVPATPGSPYRAASKPGVFMSMLQFPGVSDKFRRLVGDDEKEEETIEIEAVSIGGYTFGVRCELRKDDAKAGEVRALFDVHLTSGDWDNNVPWPFAKKITLVLAHTGNRENDVILPLCSSRECAVVKKPEPGRCNRGHRSEPVTWTEIEKKGLVCNDNLYVYVELE